MSSQPIDSNRHIADSSEEMKRRLAEFPVRGCSGMGTRHICLPVRSIRLNDQSSDVARTLPVVVCHSTQ